MYNYKAPSMLTSSIDMASKLSENFCLEFCARERSLPYAKMIHGRMLVAAMDYNLQTVDIKAVFLLAEATIVMLKNLVTKLASRSKFKHQLRSQAVYELHEANTVTDNKILEARRKRLNVNDIFGLDPDLMDKLRTERNEEEARTSDQQKEIDAMFGFKLNFIADQNTGEKFQGEEEKVEGEGKKEKSEFDSGELSDPMNVPVRKLPATLFDLKNLLKVRVILRPVSSIYN